MLPQRLFPPFVFSVLHLESDGVSILYTFLALLNSARGETALYISRSNGNNLKFFLIEHPYFYAPTFSRDLYEILIRHAARWEAGGAAAPQILADQLTLSRPGGTHYPHPVLPAPPDF